MERKQIILIGAVAAAFVLVLVSVLLISGGKNDDGADISPGQEPYMSVMCLKCGAADAFVIIKDGHAAVIDCGEYDDGGKVVSYLRLSGIETVDQMIISHFDKDHVGGAAKIIRELEVKEIYTTYLSKDSDEIGDFQAACGEKGIEPVIVTEETVLSLNGERTDGGASGSALATMTIYPPEKTDYGKDNSNNSSLAVMLSDLESGRSMFFTGDAENKRIKELVSLPVACDVIKVPHHGRYESRFVDLLRVCSPSYAVITSSAVSPEDSETMEILKDKGVETYLTRNGTVTFEFYPDGIKVLQ